MSRIVLLIAILCLAAGAQKTLAALGDSESQIAEVYGKPVDQGFPNQNGISTNTYQNADYIILVQFLGRYSLAESYTRIDRHEFSEKELSTFLEKSSHERTWKKDPNKLDWQRSDHKARAWCETLSGRPTFLIEAN